MPDTRGRFRDKAERWIRAIGRRLPSWIVFLLVALAAVVWDEALMAGIRAVADFLPDPGSSLGFVGVLVAAWLVLLVTDAYLDVKQENMDKAGAQMVAVIRVFMFGLVLFAVLVFSVFFYFVTPDLDVTIDRFYMGVPSLGGNLEETNSIFFAAVVIENRSAPTRIRSWDAAMVPTNGGERVDLECDPERLREQFNMDLTHPNLELVLDSTRIVRRSVLLANRRNIQIGRADRMIGMIVCYGEYLPQGRFVDEDYGAEVTITDMYDRDYSAMLATEGPWERFLLPDSVEEQG